MQCRANRLLGHSIVLSVVLYVVFLIHFTILYGLFNREKEYGAVFIMFFVEELLFMTLIIVACRLKMYVISASPEGITVTRRSKILFNYNWSEIKDFGSVRTPFGFNIIYFSTYILRQGVKESLYLRLLTKKDLFFAYADNDIIDYAILNSKKAGENTNCTQMNNFDSKIYTRRLALMIAIFSVIFAISHTVLFADYLGLLAINIVGCTVLNIVICAISAYVFSKRYSRLLKLYANRLEYDGETVKIVSNDCLAEIIRELDLSRVRQIGTVTERKNKYIYFTERPIQNADIKTVRKLYKNKSLIYCEYDEALFEQLKIKYSEKIKF